MLKKYSDRVPPEMVAFRLGIIRGQVMAVQEKKRGARSCGLSGLMTNELELGQVSSKVECIGSGFCNKIA